ncbi:hypothetical protein PYCCODRAFT_1373263 [Trametes coccinea BRFM310]|uniref:Zn(2)-C6 fungal-type domain-containing protein n=1 Tax=Trametes coccinea (strain BRFM310) TaxID=1353009 RepID=A0A1Y2IHN0_TRAC3|nr:hypothetical protein PYCCODRAFT_1373263 [Trametes coccinea BRFM310]
MATNAHSPNGNHESAKRPKLQRACDLCRKKKSDGPERPNNQCSKCISYGVDCTYDVVNKRPPTKSYVEILESRLQKMEQLVDRLQPQSKSPPLEHEQRASENSPRPSISDQSSPIASTSTSAVVVPTLNSPSPPDSADLDPSDDEMETTRKLIHSFRRFSLRPPLPMRYYGKSSNLMLLQTAVDMKLAYQGIDSEEFIPEPSEALKEEECALLQSFQLVVPEDSQPFTDFPEPDLMQKLVSTYFTDIHPYVPVLHRQTFEKSLEDGLHLRDEGFGAVVLLVCANACGWILESEDPRISSVGTQKRPGLYWFLEVEKRRRSLLSPTRLCDLQKYVLMAIYLGSYGSPHTCWTLLGVGLRAAQDIGIHRQKTYQSMSKPEAESWKRAFWCLLSLDRHLGFGLGRPCALQDEDFDVEPLTECDDEYWFTGNPETDFQQPAGKPSKITYMNCLSRLLQILAFASRTIYSINKSKLLLGFVGHEWEERIVAELDSALNRWIDTVPDHLRWDPHREDVDFLNQSAALYAKYYQLQIVIHRPFLPTIRKTETSRLSFPSLAICTNAARSCVHISDVQFKRAGRPLALKLNRISLFLAGVVLLINMWAGKKAGLANQSATEDVQKCLKMLKALEPYSHSAGRFWHILNALYSAGDFKTSESPASSRKRGRESAEDIPSSSSEGVSGQVKPPASSAKPNANKWKYAPSSSINPETVACAQPPDSTHGHPPRAGSDSVSEPSTTATNSPASFDLPVHTEDLGRIPFNQGFSPSLFGPGPGVSNPFTQQSQSQTQTQTPSTLFQSQPLDPASTMHAFPENIGAAAFQQPSAFMGGASTFTAPYAPATPSQLGQASFDFSQVPPQQPSMQTFPGQPQLSAQDLSAAAAINMQQGFTVDALALADNTLEMWSSAPTSMDWADWGAFINNVSGGSGDGTQFVPPEADFPTF